MDTFFHETLIENTDISLKPEESFHLATVLRKKPGEAVCLMDGKGSRGVAEIIVPDKKCSILRIKSVEFHTEVHFHTIAIAPTKNIDRFEFFLEKAVEIGVKSFIPMLTKNAERKVLNMERMEKIILSASKQSKTAYLPSIHPLQKFTEVIAFSGYDQKLIATCTEKTVSLKEAYQPRKNSIIFVGPEGDFSPEEVNLAMANRVLPISLGEQRLRVETAGITICAQIVLLNQ